MLRYGEVTSTREYKVQGFAGRAGAMFKTKPGNTMVFMYLGTVTPDSAPHFRADNVLAGLGYGPIMASVTQRAVVEALRVAGTAIQHVEDGGTLPDALDLLAQVDEALIRTVNFMNGSEHLSPILKDAARFNALIDLLCAPGDLPTMLDRQAGIEATLLRALGAVAVDIDADMPMRERLVAIVDAATAK